MKSLVLVPILILISTFISHAFLPVRSYQIKGTVVDSVSAKGIPYATISVQSKKQGVIKKLASDINGNFDFSKSCKESVKETERACLADAISKIMIDDTYKWVVILPGLGCHGCIQEAEFFMMEHIENGKRFVNGKIRCEFY
jgi:hypothetical protein